MLAVGCHHRSIQAIIAIGRAALSLGFVLGLAGCTASGPEAPARGSAEPDLGRVQLVGLGSTDLEGLLGRPALLRSERQAQYWRYTMGSCQLDLFLYAERDAGPARVLYVDARPAGYASPERIASCARLRSVLRGEPRSRPLGARAESVGLPADGAY